MSSDEDIAAIEEIVRAERDAFNTSDNGQFARYELSRIRFPRPDVALASVDVNAATETGEALEIDHSMVSLFVLIMRAGRWVVAHRQDTIVPGQRKALAPRGVGSEGQARGASVQWTTAFSACAPVRERTSISAYFASLRSFEKIVPR
jgi:hypothetical protein